MKEIASVLTLLRDQDHVWICTEKLNVSEEEISMENPIVYSNEQEVETRKTWVAPELKKVDVEEITALGGTGDDDNEGFS